MRTARQGTPTKSPSAPLPTSRPSAVSADEWAAKLSVAARATFCRKNPKRANRTIGSDNQWPSVSATVCMPRWWLSSWASTPASSGRVRRSTANDVTTTRWPPHANALSSFDGRIRTTKSSGRRSLRAASEVQTGPMASSSRGSGRRAPSSGVRTATWTGRTNNSAPSASQVAGSTQNGMSHTQRSGSQMITRATNQNGTRAATGKNAVTAELSTCRVRRPVPNMQQTRIRSRATHGR